MPSFIAVAQLLLSQPMNFWIHPSAKYTRGRRAIRPRALKYSLRQKINEGNIFFINKKKKKIAPVKFSDRLLQNVTSKHNINFWTFKLWNHVYSVQKKGEIA